MLVRSGERLRRVMETKEAISGIRAVLLSHEEFEHWWPGIQVAMDAVPHTWEQHTKEEICTRVHDDTLQVWAVGDNNIEMIVFTQVACYATKKVLQVIWTTNSGNLEKKIEAIATALEHYAKINGCSEVDVSGRPGWGKVLKRYGFKKTSEIYTAKVVHRGIQ